MRRSLRAWLMCQWRRHACRSLRRRLVRTAFGSPLELSRVHWVRPEVAVEVTYLTWTEGGLLCAVSYQGQRQDKPARQVVRSAVPAR